MSPNRILATAFLFASAFASADVHIDEASLTVMQKKSIPVSFPSVYKLATSCPNLCKKLQPKVM